MSDKETHKVEFKSDWRDVHLKAISAFANSSGGKLIIGVDDHGKPVGLKNVKKLLEDLPNIIRNKLGIIPPVELEKSNGHEVIKITVPPSPVPISYHGKFYLRSGSTVQELQGQTLADFLIRKTGNTWDGDVDKGAGINLIDDATVEDFKRYAMDRLPSLARETDVLTVLNKLNLFEGKNLKRAGVLLFTRDPQQYYSHAVVKIGRFLTETDIQTTDVVKGNLFRQLETTLEILRTKYLQSQIKFEGIHRRDILEYPYEALREAVINALIHRDYRGSSHIQIRIYPDKLVIMNEGALPPEVPLEKLKTEHLSKPRNRLLADVFYFAGFIEAWGRGTLKIVEKCLEIGLPEPEFKEEHGVMSIVFYKDIYTTKFLKELGLNERQIKAVIYVKENGKITNKNIQELFNVSRETATRDLAFLKEREILESSGKRGPGVYYVLK